MDGGGTLERAMTYFICEVIWRLDLSTSDWVVFQYYNFFETRTTFILVNYWERKQKNMNNEYNRIKINLQTTRTDLPPSNTEKQRLLQNYQRNSKNNHHPTKHQQRANGKLINNSQTKHLMKEVFEELAPRILKRKLNALTISNKRTKHRPTRNIKLPI